MPFIFLNWDATRFKVGDRVLACFKEEYRQEYDGDEEGDDDGISQMTDWEEERERIEVGCGLAKFGFGFVQEK